MHLSIKRRFILLFNGKTVCFGIVTFRPIYVELVKHLTFFMLKYQNDSTETIMWETSLGRVKVCNWDYSVKVSDGCFTILFTLLQSIIIGEFRVLTDWNVCASWRFGVCLSPLGCTLCNGKILKADHPTHIYPTHPHMGTHSPSLCLPLYPILHPFLWYISLLTSVINRLLVICLFKDLDDNFWTRFNDHRPAQALTDLYHQISILSFIVLFVFNTFVVFLVCYFGSPARAPHSGLQAVSASASCPHRRQRWGWWW